MIDALGSPQSVLLLGGTSDIALATAERWADRADTSLRVVLGARPSAARDAAAARLESARCTVTVLDFDARDTDLHPEVVKQAFADGDIDVAVVAFGVLGDAEQAWQQHARAVELAQVNYVGAVSCGVALAQRMRDQGHGVIVALSSVAGERVRRSNFVYGSTKAGMDGFYLGLGEALRGSGVRVVVVRPGFVRSKMTAGMKATPMSVTADQVAEAVVDAVTAGKDLVWVPTALRAVMSGVRHVPRPLFRRLPM
jgi:decaprenylphospho-beta-D-erythro-pentofuranosid-2-ulose 2-reductase